MQGISFAGTLAPHLLVTLQAFENMYFMWDLCFTYMLIILETLQGRCYFFSILPLRKLSRFTQLEPRSLSVQNCLLFQTVLSIQIYFLHQTLVERNVVYHPRSAGTLKTMCYSAS